jgi:hypothetical protein
MAVPDFPYMDAPNWPSIFFVLDRRDVFTLRVTKRLRLIRSISARYMHAKEATCCGNKAAQLNMRLRKPCSSMR